MDLTFSEEQEMVRKSSRQFLEKECPPSEVRKIEASPKGHSPQLWKKMSELGWLGFTYPEKYGGSAGSIAKPAVIVEELGRAAAPTPYLSTVVLCGEAILAAGNEAQKTKFLPKIANGDLIMALALTEPQVGWDAGSVKMSAKKTDTGFVLSGSKLFVHAGAVADWLLCVARTAAARGNSENGLTVFLVDARTPGVTITPLDTIANDKQCEIIFKDVKVSSDSVLGAVNKGWQSLKPVLERAAALQSAEIVGNIQKSLELAVDYSKVRVQFGRPIGTFQAIQHYCADMLTDVERSRYATYKACWKLVEGMPASIDISVAKAVSSDACQRVTWLSHQIFASISYFQDHDMQIYFRRAKVQELNLGDARYHRELVAQGMNF